MKWRNGLPEIYRKLLAARGHAAWWPAKTPFEVCVGAILVQNTAWTNAERAIASLRSRRLLSYSALARLEPAQLAPVIRSAGAFNVKARRLLAFVRFLGAEYAGEVAAMAREEPARLRTKLLEVHGIGRETADSIGLYAAGLPLFVVDAYTRRIFARLGWLEGGEDYDEIQRLFHRNLPPDAALYNDFHAQLVMLGKDVCRPRPRCAVCPLQALCPRAGVMPGEER